MALFAFMLIDHYVDSSPLRRTVLSLHRIG
jgi:hypothetical protein